MEHTPCSAAHVRCVSFLVWQLPFSTSFSGLSDGPDGLQFCCPNSSVHLWRHLVLRPLTLNTKNAKKNAKCVTTNWDMPYPIWSGEHAGTLIFKIYFFSMFVTFLSGLPPEIDLLLLLAVCMCVVVCCVWCG